MKHILISLVTIVLLAGCKKNDFRTAERITPEGKALVKIALFSTTVVSKNVVISVNDQRVSPPTANYNTAYPGGGLGTTGLTNSDYLALNPGVNNFSLDVIATGSPVFTSNYFKGTATFEANKRYMYAVVDTGANTKSFSFNVDTETPDSGFVKVIFGHGMPNVPAVDVYKGSTLATAQILFSNVPYLGNSEWATVPAGADSIFLRVAGSPNTGAPIVRRGGLPFPNQRITTIISRGYAGSTAGFTVPTAALFYNQ